MKIFKRVLVFSNPVTIKPVTVNQNIFVAMDVIATGGKSNNYAVVSFISTLSYLMIPNNYTGYGSRPLQAP